MSVISKTIMRDLEKKQNSVINVLKVLVNLTSKAKESRVVPLILNRSGKNAAFQNVVRINFWDKHCYILPIFVKKAHRHNKSVHLF